MPEHVDNVGGDEVDISVRREWRMENEKKRCKVGEHSCKYLVGVSFISGLVMIVVVTGELVIVLGGVNCDSGRWSAGPLMEQAISAKSY